MNQKEIDEALAIEKKMTGQVSTEMKKYRVIYADPPWWYHDNDSKTPSTNGDSFVTEGRRSSQYINKEGRRVTCRPLYYPQMKEEEIKALPIKALADKDCTLFCWATSYFLDQTFRVIDAWGFTYKSMLVWDKCRQQMGVYNKANCEFLLIAGRGNSKPTRPCDRRLQYNLPWQVVKIDRGDAAANKAPGALKHSQKPDWFAECYIDHFWPEGNRIELFARRARPGWDVWGNEAPGSIELFETTKEQS